MDESSKLCVPSHCGSSHSALHHRDGATTGRRCCRQVRGIGSKGAVLVNIWSLLVIASVSSSEIITTIDTKVEFVVGVVILIVSPIAGLLASIYFGRYRTLSTGLWLMWAGDVVICSLLILQWLIPEAQQKVFFSFEVVITCTSLVFSVGLVLFLVIAVPFGLDQMPDASGEQTSAFIFWYTWSMVTGYVFVLVLQRATPCYIHLTSSEATLFLTLVSVALLSVTLCSKFLLRGWLIIEPRGINPLQKFCGVLRFAAKHKIPVRRSAFTYWEEVKPSRLDLAKTKYGGPYTHEEVEDIKTILRMVVVIASISVALTVFYSHAVSARKSLGSDVNTDCNVQNQLSLAATLATVLGFCAYEVLIRPLIKKWIPSIIRRVGCSQTLSITASLLLLVSATVWYVNTNSSTCMNSLPFTVNHNWIEVPYSILTFCFILLMHTAMMEFVCAQAPYVLRGLLVGLVHSVGMCSFALGVGITIAWRVSYQEKAPNSPSCGVWFYLFTTITATLGCVLWCAVAKWYKRRERDEPDMCRIFAENYYDH